MLVHVTNSLAVKKPPGAFMCSSLGSKNTATVDCVLALTVVVAAPRRKANESTENDHWHEASKQLRKVTIRVDGMAEHNGVL